MDKKVYIKQDGTIPGHRIIEELERRGIINTVGFRGCTHGIYVVLNDVTEYTIGRYAADSPFIHEGYTELLYNKETDSFYENSPALSNSLYTGKDSQRMKTGEAKESLLSNKSTLSEKEKETIREKITYVLPEIESFAIPEGYEAIIEDEKIIVRKKWTIKDAKPGVILKTRSFVFIFKNIDEENGVHYYCAYEIEKHEDDEQFHVALSQSLMGIVGGNLTEYQPASISEIDKLNQFIDEAGYEWDADKLELRKKKWQPKEGDTVWRVHNFNGFFPTSDTCDRDYQIGVNDFQTKEECQAFCDSLNAAIKQIIEERRKEIQSCQHTILT